MPAGWVHPALSVFALSGPLGLPAPAWRAGSKRGYAPEGQDLNEEKAIHAAL